MTIMHKHLTNQESDHCYCIYEFIICDKNLDCISCKIANKYWDEIKKSIEEETDSIPNHVDIMKERVTG